MNEKALSSYFSNPRPEMLEFLPENFECVLDVGCGGGDFSLALKDLKECEVWGIEPDQRAHKIASTRLDKVLLGGIEDIATKLPDRHFDIVLFNDVLEHMAEPDAAIAIAKRVLTEDGAIIVSLPNVRYFHTVVDLIFRKDWQYQDFGILDRTHLRFFTKLSATRMFEKSGLNVYTLQGINPTGSLWFRLFNFLFLKSIDDMKFLQFAFVLYKSEQI